LRDYIMIALIPDISELKRSIKQDNKFQK
jgi:hypothetical protein